MLTQSPRQGLQLLWKQLGMLLQWQQRQPSPPGLRLLCLIQGQAALVYREMQLLSASPRSSNSLPRKSSNSCSLAKLACTPTTLCSTF